ncbi:hypothetical protein ABW19_dt0207709 [Dactylella cylindrospora]|nr:hypothetical protein ABW19_dt0207709 [Dactylella cylindrospora]
MSFNEREKRAILSHIARIRSPRKNSDKEDETKGIDQAGEGKEVESASEKDLLRQIPEYDLEKSWEYNNYNSDDHNTNNATEEQQVERHEDLSEIEFPEGRGTDDEEDFVVYYDSEDDSDFAMSTIKKFEGKIGDRADEFLEDVTAVALQADLRVGIITATAGTTVKPTDSTWIRTFRNNLSKKVQEQFWARLSDGKRSDVSKIKTEFLTKYPNHVDPNAARNEERKKKSRQSTIRQGRKSLGLYLQACNEMFRDGILGDEWAFAESVIAGLKSKRFRREVSKSWNATDHSSWSELQKIIVGQVYVPGEDPPKDVERFVAGKKIKDENYDSDESSDESSSESSDTSESETDSERKKKSKKRKVKKSKKSGRKHNSDSEESSDSETDSSSGTKKKKKGKGREQKKKTTKKSDRELIEELAAKLEKLNKRMDSKPRGKKNDTTEKSSVQTPAPVIPAIPTIPMQPDLNTLVAAALMNQMGPFLQNQAKVPNATTSQSSTPGVLPINGATRKKAFITCHNCLEKGHMSDECPRPKVSSEQLQTNRDLINKQREDYRKTQEQKQKLASMVQAQTTQLAQRLSGGNSGTQTSGEDEKEYQLGAVAQAYHGEEAMAAQKRKRGVAANTRKRQAMVEDVTDEDIPKKDKIPDLTVERLNDGNIILGETHSKARAVQEQLKKDRIQADNNAAAGKDKSLNMESGNDDGHNRPVEPAEVDKAESPPEVVDIPLNQRPSQVVEEAASKGEEIPRPARVVPSGPSADEIKKAFGRIPEMLMYIPKDNKYVPVPEGVQKGIRIDKDRLNKIMSEGKESGEPSPDNLRKKKEEAVVKMIEGEGQFDVKQSLNKTMVTLSLAQLVQLSPRVRATIADLLRLTSRGKKQTAAALLKEPVEADKAWDDDNLTVGLYIDSWVEGDYVPKTLADGGATVELISQKYVDKRGLKKIPVTDGTTLKLANEGENEVAYYVWIRVNVQGIVCNLKAYVMPVEDVYTVLLGRSWLRRVRAIDHTHEHKLTIQGIKGLIKEVKGVNAPRRKIDVVVEKDSADELEEVIEELLKENDIGCGTKSGSGEVSIDHDLAAVVVTGKGESLS